MTDEQGARRAKYVAEVRKAYREGELTDTQVDALRAAGVDIDGRQPIRPGVNDFAITHPDLAKQWHPTKNGELTPKDVTAGSNRKVWWRCDKGHEWEATVAQRACTGSKCPYCVNRKIVSGENDLATTHPWLVVEWHPDKNGTLTPADVVAGSSRKVWWRHWCEKTESWHEWEATVSQRAKGAGCPYCSGRLILPGFNDLSTTRPDLAEQWHPTKNGDLTPVDVMAGSNRKVWWRCDKGHEWRAPVVRRSSGSRCPECLRTEKGKAVRCIETGSVYETITRAAWAVGLSSRSKISMVLSGKRKTAGGFHWEYVDGNGKEGESE